MRIFCAATKHPDLAPLKPYVRVRHVLHYYALVGLFVEDLVKPGLRFRRQGPSMTFTPPAPSAGDPGPILKVPSTLA